jgi:archaellum component FlaF (FlaF/FlaG flagellin family)
MRRFCSLLVSTFLLLGSCTDYSVNKIIETAPEIVVDPVEHDFGHVNAQGVSETTNIHISNAGSEDLLISSINVVGSITFSMSALGAHSIEPGDTTTVNVTFNPVTYENSIAQVEIRSNDEDEALVIVPLVGAGDAPVVYVAPDEYDFGSVVLGCDDEVNILIGNIGNVDLEINNIDFFASVPVDFYISNYELEHGPLPWTIAPSAVNIITVAYEPLDLLDDGAWVEVHSNDPIDPLVGVDQLGIGDYAGMITETFEQVGTIKTDILFVIDNSGSMSRNQSNIKDNFDYFINVFNAASADYQIAFITTDDQNFVDGKIVSNLSTDPVAEVAEIIDHIGTSGSATETGVYYTWYSMQPGGDAELGGAFSRADSKLVVIYVSDEPDFAERFTTMTWLQFADDLKSQRSSNALVSAHAVAGDYPSGCSTSFGYAQFGSGYYDVVTELGGEYMSICATDWGNQMDTLARETIASSIYYLGSNPIEPTIEVVVNGIIVTNWEYDEILNAIVFDTAPAEKSITDITYALWGDCGEKKATAGDTGI